MEWDEIYQYWISIQRLPFINYTAVPNNILCYNHDFLPIEIALDESTKQKIYTLNYNFYTEPQYDRDGNLANNFDICWLHKYSYLQAIIESAGTSYLHIRDKKLSDLVDKTATQLWFCRNNKELYNAVWLSALSLQLLKNFDKYFAKSIELSTNTYRIIEKIHGVCNRELEKNNLSPLALQGREKYLLPQSSRKKVDIVDDNTVNINTILSLLFEEMQNIKAIYQIYVINDRILDETIKQIYLSVNI